MGIDILSYAMGKAAGGGGGAKTLFSSGWIKSYGSYTECEGNSVEFKTGSSTAHNLFLAPPANVARDGSFPKNSVCKIAVKVNAINPRLNVRSYSTASGNTITSATGLFEAQSGGRVFAQATGSDVLTITLGGAASESLIFEPVNAGGTSDGNASATITITGMAFNGETIFGSV